jgi:hypothetical protein
MLALVVHACDRYELLFPGFSYFFEKYWDPSISITRYFLTEELEVSLPGFISIRSGRGEWSDRLRRGLDQIPASHVLYLQEDVWLSAPVSAKFFEELSIFLKEQKPNLIKLHSADIYQTSSTEKIFDGLRLTKLNNKASKFLMSHQVSIWEKGFLKAQLWPNEHPWRNERKATQRLRKLDPEIWHIDLFAGDGAKPNNDNPNNSRRSGYDSVSGNGMLWVTVDAYIEVLNQDSSPTWQAYGQKLRKHFDEKLTHDGQPAPRNEDIFKKIKKKIKHYLSF